MPRNAAILEEHLRVLSIGYPLSISDDGEWVIVHGFKLPPGYDRASTNVLVQIPADYPMVPPGVDSGVYIPLDVRFGGRKLRSVYKRSAGGWGEWGWLCYKWIRWDPCSDNLVTLMEMIRAHLTNPPTE